MGSVSEHVAVSPCLIYYCILSLFFFWSPDKSCTAALRVSIFPYYDPHHPVGPRVISPFLCRFLEPIYAAIARLSSALWVLVNVGHPSALFLCQHASLLCWQLSQAASVC